MNKAETVTALQEKTELIEENLQRLAGAFQGPPILKEAMSYSLLGGGKRIRPLMLLASAEACGLPDQEVLDMACALEMIHTYSLIHDDLPAMDNDDLRRGKPTSHRQFGEAMAILAGDALLNEAMLLLMERYGGTSAGADAIAGIARASGKDGMIGGQVLDIESEGKEIDLDTLKEMHSNKTGALIRAALTSPWRLAGKSESEIRKMEELGTDIGVMFQIQDDVLDVESDAQTMGKTVGKDARDHKSTYVSILGLEASKELTKDIYERVMNSVSETGPGGEQLKRLADLVYKRNH